MIKKNENIEHQNKLVVFQGKKVYSVRYKIYIGTNCPQVEIQTSII